MVFVIWLGVALVSRGRRDARALRHGSPGSTLLTEQLRRPRAGPVQGPERLRPVPRAGAAARAARAARAAAAADRPDARSCSRLGILVLGVVSYSRAAWLNLGGRRRRDARGAAAAARRDARAGALLLTIVVCVAAAGGDRPRSPARRRSSRSARTCQTYDSQRFGAQRSGIELAERHPIGIGPGAVRGRRADLRAQHLRPRAGRGGRARADRDRGACCSGR